jgi:5-methylcytosine-specific restriction endonuclease McrA
VAADDREEARRRAARERARQWKQRHPEYRARRRDRYAQLPPDAKEKIRAKARACLKVRYERDRARVLAANKAWHERNRDRIRDAARKRREANLDALREADRKRRRERYAADPAAWSAYLKEWRRRNPDRAHAYVRASNIKRRRAAGRKSFTAAEWLALLAAYDGKCGYCGVAGPLEIDHRIPLIRGGTNTIENIIPRVPGLQQKRSTR